MVAFNDQGKGALVDVKWAAPPVRGAGRALRSRLGAVGAIGLTASVCAGACGSSTTGGSSGYPTESIVLCGNGCVNKTDPTDTVTKFHDGTATYSWGGVDELDPVLEADIGEGEPQKLTWAPAYLNQELIAYNLDYSGAMPGCNPIDCCSPVDCFAPTSIAAFSSILGPSQGSGPFPAKEKDLVAFTDHLVLYDHGECRITQPWAPLFDTLSSTIENTLACLGSCQDITLHHVTLDGDMFQPHFTSQLDDIRHGFEFKANYDLDLTVGIRACPSCPPAFFQDSPQVSVNPAYSFGVDPNTGLLAVTPLNKGLVSVLNDNSANEIKMGLQKAMTQTVPAQVEMAIANALTQVPPLDQEACDPTASLAAQQSFCFDTFTKGGPGESLAWEALQIGFTKLGQPHAETVSNANAALPAISPQNFVCQSSGPNPDGQPATGLCAIHPVFERVNVLPDAFEFVLAETHDDQANQLLYTALGGIAGQTLCGQPVTRCQSPGEGCPVDLRVHGPLTLTAPEPSFTCPAASSFCP